MTNSETEKTPTRDDLMQRVALMEEMIAEGRQSTVRRGYIFLTWGLLYFAATGWVIFLPRPAWAWPVCVVAGIVFIGVVKSRQKETEGESESVQSRGIEAVWKGMGLATSLYVITAFATHHAADPAYMGAVLFLIGLAHAISAMILRWAVQGAVAAIWWISGIAVFFTTSYQSVGIFLIATFFGMIVFGIYAMWHERQRTAAPVHHHA